MTTKVLTFPGVIRPKSLGEVTVTSSSTALTSEERNEERVLSSTDVSVTSPEVSLQESDQVEQFPIERVYPHLFDEEGLASQVRVYMVKALDDARNAINHFGEANLDAVDSCLALVATTLASAYPLTHFNENLGAVVAFVRRATLTASSADITRSELNSLVHVLQFATSNLMMSLDEASDLIDKLSDDGWQGNDTIADELIKTLLEPSDLVAEQELQAELFAEQQAHTDRE